MVLRPSSKCLRSPRIEFSLIWRRSKDQARLWTDLFSEKIEDKRHHGKEKEKYLFLELSKRGVKKESRPICLKMEEHVL
jgi:hypothetical protein